MKITCPQCSTMYELDERVLPPGGAPVQCTRCQHVFDAHPPDLESGKTRMFGGAAPSPEQRETQIFGAPPPPPAGGNHRDTAIFGLPTVAAEPPPEEAARLELPPEGPGERGSQKTQIFGIPTQGGPSPKPAPAAAPRPAARPGPDRRPRAEADPVEVLRAARARRRNAVLLGVAALAIAVLGWAGWRLWTGRRIPVPPEAVSAHGRAMDRIRRDDPESLAAARAELEVVVQRWPQFMEARADRAIAVALQFDDAKARHQRIADEAALLNAQVARLKERQAPEGWQAEVDEKIERLRALQKQSDPLAAERSILDQAASDASRALQEAARTAAPDEAVHFARAQAIFNGVRGSDQALTFSERYRSLGGAAGWGEIALAEYALNARVAPQTRKQAREGLEALRARDPSWVRVYVLIGRLLLADRAADAAIPQFDSALTLNPAHATARAFLEAARADAESVDSSP